MALLGRILNALLAVSAYTRPPPSSYQTIDSAAVESVREALGGNLQSQPATQVRWYMSDLESARYEADSGDLARAGRLCDAMRADGTVSGVMSSITGGLVRLPKRFRGNPEIVAELERGHDSIRSIFDEMVPPAELEALAADYKLLKVAVGELLPVEGRDYPVLCRLDPQFLRYRWIEGRWYFNSVAGPIPITPGDGRWVLFLGPRLSPWKFGKWMAVGRSFIIKEQAVLTTANWEGKLANPARVGEVPAGATDADAQTYIQRIAQWGLNTVFALRPGWKISLLESKGEGYQSYVKTIDRCDREIMVDLAGQIMTTTGGEGFANSATGLKIQADILQELAEELAFTINTQILPQFIVRRWGLEALATPAVMAWDTATAKDQLARANALVAAAAAVKGLYEALKQFGVSPDVTELCAEFGVPVSGDMNGDGEPEGGAEPPDGESDERMGIDLAAIAQMLDIAQRAGLRAKSESLRKAIETAGVELEPAPTEAPQVLLPPAEGAKVLMVDEAREAQGRKAIGGDKGAMLLVELDKAEAEQDEDETEPEPEAEAEAEAEPEPEVEAESEFEEVEEQDEDEPAAQTTAATNLQAAAKWEESKHPRKGGKFAPKGSGDSGKKDDKKPAPKRRTAKRPTKRAPAKKRPAPKRKTKTDAQKKREAAKKTKEREAKRKAKEKEKAKKAKEREAAKKAKAKEAEKKRKAREADRKKREAAKKAAKKPASQRKSAKPKTPPEHTPEHWEEHYKHLGAAAKHAAYGHAMVERGLTHSVSHALENLQHLKADTATYKQRKAIARIEKLSKGNPSMSMAELSDKDPFHGMTIRAFGAMSAHVDELRAHGTMTPTMRVSESTNESPGAMQMVNRAHSFYSAMASKEYTFNDVVVDYIEEGNPRASYSQGRNRVKHGGEAENNSAVIEHELGHCLEGNNENVRRAAQEFLEKRTAGEPIKKLKDLHPKAAYDDHEVCKPDNFIRPYVGKIYGHGATEVMSMACEYLAREPNTLLTKDPEMFHFVLGVLRGVK